MAFPELTAFSRQLARVAPDAAEEHLSNLGCARELAKYLRARDAIPFAMLMDAATHLIEVLAEGGVTPAGVDLDWTHSAACRLVEMVEHGLVERAEARAAAAPAPQAQVREEAGRAASDGVDAAPAKQLDVRVPAPAELGVGEQPVAAEHAEDFPAIHDMVLGKMLLALGHATRDQLATALRMQRAQGMRVGECLLMIGATSPDNLLEALRLQERMRAEGTSGSAPTPAPAQAPAGAHDDLGRRAAAEAAAAFGGDPVPPRPVADAPKPKNAAMRVTPEIFFGEVLLGAEMITNEELEQAMHIHHLEHVRVGEALLRLGALTEEDIESGLELQRQLRFIAGLPKNTPAR